MKFVDHVTIKDNSLTVVLHSRDSQCAWPFHFITSTMWLGARADCNSNLVIDCWDGIVRWSVR